MALDRGAEIPEGLDLSVMQSTNGVPKACSSQGLNLKAPACQTLLPPQCRTEKFGCPWKEEGKAKNKLLCMDPERPSA